MQVLHFQITQDANKQNKTTLTKLEVKKRGKQITIKGIIEDFG